jgi:hypothetical protein
MTRPKRPDRRLDFPPGQATTEDIVATARFLFLCEAAESNPTILKELATLEPDDETALGAWAERWGLTADWCKAQARAAITDHRAGVDGFSVTRHGWGWSGDELTSFGWTADPGRQPPMWTHKDREAFQRLAHYVCGRQSFARIASEARVSVPTVHESVRSLAALIGLPLRPTLAGRPRKRPAS